jgi:DNA-directed RNA polymerase subunit E'/Rpb7
VPALGLCVTLYEILEVEGGAVYAGEGAALFTVKFSMARAARRCRFACACA